MNFRKLLGINTQNSERNPGELFVSLEALLSDHNDEDIRRIAGLAGLLGKVAYADRDISAEELRKIRELLTKETPLSPPLFDAVLALLEKHTVTLAGIEDHRYTQLLNDTLQKSEKQQVLRSLFAVAAANDSVSFVENNTISTIAHGLRLSNDEFIQAREPFLAQLDILKG